MLRKNNDIVIGLGFGDEGKGTIVDFLSQNQTPEYVVRFSGGSQAAHNVITEDEKHHTFSQFGSGTFRGVKTLLSSYMLVNPFNMAREANALAPLIGRDPFELAYISADALLITPLHVAANRHREILRGANPHGSCGEGIGETRSYGLRHPNTAPKIGDLKNPGILYAKLNIYREWAEKQFGDLGNDIPSNDEIMESYLSLLEDRPFNIVNNLFVLDALRKGYNIFEGSQGILLDEKLGFHPHTTWSHTADGNAQRLLRDAGLPMGNTIGVTRTYQTRHGFGPFPTEFNNDYDWTTRYPELHNEFGRWQGNWRVGLLDLPLLNYGYHANFGVNEIALTHMDVEIDEVVTSYKNMVNPHPVFDKDLNRQEILTNQLFKAEPIKQTVTGSKQVRELVEQTLNTKVTIESHGNRSDAKRFIGD